MKPCIKCETFKKADNCIRCFFEQRKRNEELIKDIRRIANDTPYYRTQESILKYLKGI